MKLKLKDYIAIAVVAIFSFPLIYLSMLFMTGNARIEFGPPQKDRALQEKIEIMKSSVKKDSLAILNSKTYEALQLEKKELEKERKLLLEQQQKLELLKEEIELQKKKITEEREKMERLVSVSDSLTKKKLKDLAKMYAAMKPIEAAQILETMDEKMCAEIIRYIPDDRQKAKIMEAFSNEKAVRISKILGER